MNKSFRLWVLQYSPFTSRNKKFASGLVATKIKVKILDQVTFYVREGKTGKTFPVKISRTGKNENVELVLKGDHYHGTAALTPQTTLHEIYDDGRSLASSGSLNEEVEVFVPVSDLKGLVANGAVKVVEIVL